MHRSVLSDEVYEFLNVQKGGHYLDGTVGAGGHAERILRAAGENGRLLALDRDQSALKLAEQKLTALPGESRIRMGNFAELERYAKAEGFSEFDGILLDIGVSSMQLDQATRGFSFLQDGPLDMRMNREQELTAAGLVNELDQVELTRIIREYGEDRRASRIAAGIIRAREKEPMETTLQLAAVIEGCAGGKPEKTHAATRTFQALRIEVNDELGCLKAGLESGLRMLKSGGRMAVITFHSLEDRIVKTCFRNHAGRMVSLQEGGARWEGDMPRVKDLTRKPTVATKDEILENPRSRSAKLRVVEKE